MVLLYSSLANVVLVMSREITGPCVKQNSPLHGTRSIPDPAHKSSSRQTSFMLAGQNPIRNRLLAHTPCTRRPASCYSAHAGFEAVYWLAWEVEVLKGV